jgi:hypothetical protein
MQSEAVYRKDQKTAQEDWIKNNPDYWKNYRSNHKKYADRNREQQHRRNRLRTVKSVSAEELCPIAKMDALLPEKTILSGKYQLIPMTSDMIAKMDALIVEINTISNSYTYSGP